MTLSGLSGLRSGRVKKVVPTVSNGARCHCRILRNQRKLPTAEEIRIAHEAAEQVGENMLQDIIKSCMSDMLHGGKLKEGEGGQNQLFVADQRHWLPRAAP